MRTARTRTRTLTTTALAALAAPLLAGGCARGVAVESEPGPTYTLEVHNRMPHTMSVSYDDGTGRHLLGTVPAGGHQSFVITRPARTTITVIATDQAGTHTVTRQVTLRAGTATTIELGGP